MVSQRIGGEIEKIKKQLVELCKYGTYFILLQFLSLFAIGLILFVKRGLNFDSALFFIKKYFYIKIKFYKFVSQTKSIYKATLLNFYNGK